jgi:hypothetical protein
MVLFCLLAAYFTISAASPELYVRFLTFPSEFQVQMGFGKLDPKTGVVKNNTRLMSFVGQGMAGTDGGLTAFDSTTGMFYYSNGYANNYVHSVDTLPILIGSSISFEMPPNGLNAGNVASQFLFKVLTRFLLASLLFGEAEIVDYFGQFGNHSKCDRSAVVLPH